MAEAGGRWNQSDRGRRQAFGIHLSSCSLSLYSSCESVSVIARGLSCHCLDTVPGQV